jgi:putative pyruvate formate lyase activating enzyme
MAPAAYLELQSLGELRRRAEQLELLLGSCCICPRCCAVDRLHGGRGACGSGYLPMVSWYGPHFGEEPPISGIKGAGNIFFANCNLRCVYCQNHRISQNPGRERHHQVDFEHLAGIMLELQERGCHNLNLVSPTHFAPQIVRALVIAVGKGLRLPIVYNSNGYESVQTLQLLDGVVDVYLPDAKYSDDAVGLRYSGVDLYAVRVREALREMFRQTGAGLTFDAAGMLAKGLVIRLLVLPNELAGIEASLQFIHQELSPEVAVSLMSQYYPTHLAACQDRYALLMRKITAEEWARAVSALDRLGMENGWMQDWEQAADHYQPNFDDPDNPFEGCGL